MTPNKDATIVTVPEDASAIGDDRYLVEMTDRLQRLRSLLGEQSARITKRKRALRNRKYSKIM